MSRKRLSWKSQFMLVIVMLSGFVLTDKAKGDSIDTADAQAALLGQSHQKPSSTNTHPDAQWFSDAGLGLFIHWGVASVDATGDLSWYMLANKGWYDGTITPNNYYALIEQWKPDKLNFDQMLADAKAAGFKYAVFTAKHHDGFTLWPSAYGQIGTKHSFDGRDFVKEYVDACCKHGIKVGLYYSPPDWYFDRKYINWSYSGNVKLDMNHKPTAIPRKPKGHNQKRVELVKGQVTELLSNYGKIDILWFDGGKGEIPNQEVRRLQPGIIINRRNGEKGDYGDSEGKLPPKRFSGWFEACVPCWPIRMWSDHHNYPQASSAYSLAMLSILRAWGGNLLANVGPKGDGSLHTETLTAWADMAAWMKHSGESVHGTKPGPWPEKVNLPVTTRGQKIAYVHFLPRFPDQITGLPKEEHDITRYREVIRPMPKFTYTLTWKDVSRPPKAATLLRTGEDIEFVWENYTLTITLPTRLRSETIDVVKLQW